MKYLTFAVISFLLLAHLLAGQDDYDITGDYVLGISVDGDLTLIRCKIINKDNRFILKTSYISAMGYNCTSSESIIMDVNDKDEVKFELPWDILHEGSVIMTPGISNKADAELFEHFSGTFSNAGYFNGDVKRKITKGLPGNIKGNKAAKGQWQLLKISK